MLTGEQQALCASLEDLVEAYARRHAGRRPSVGYAEFRSAGNMGAVRAVMGWSEARGPLLPYARTFIWKEMEAAGRTVAKTWARAGLRAQAASSETSEDDPQSVWDDDAAARARAVARLSERAAALLASMAEHVPPDVEAELVDRTALEAVRRRLHALVETLPAAERDLYRLMIVEEKSFTEAAGTLGIDRSKVQRAVEALKRRLTGHLSQAA